MTNEEENFPVEPLTELLTTFISGSYAFIESSSPARKGWKARLVSPAFPSGQKKCMTFYYNMNGHTVGR